MVERLLLNKGERMMERKAYKPLQMSVVFIHTATPLLAGSVMSPGQDNEPPGARFFDDNLIVDENDL